VSIQRFLHYERGVIKFKIIGFVTNKVDLLAQKYSISINQFISSAVAEKMSEKKGFKKK